MGFPAPCESGGALFPDTTDEKSENRALAVVVRVRRARTKSRGERVVFFWGSRRRLVEILNQLFRAVLSTPRESDATVSLDLS